MINLGDDNKKKNGNNRLYEQRVYGTDKQRRDQYDKLMGRPYSKETRRPVKRNDSHGGVIALMAVFMVLIFGALLYLLFSGNQDKKKPGSTVGETPTTAPTMAVETGYDYTVVVLSVDTESKTIKMYDVEEEIERTLVYTGSSLFYAEQGSQVTAGQLKPGDFMLFNCDARQIIKKAKWVSEAWEKLRIDDLEIQENLHRMIIRGQIYKYSDDLCVISDGKRVNLDSLLTGEDKFTIRGIGDTVKEIVVTVGHGVLQLKNYEDFVDGEIMIGSRYTEVVPTSGMFVVREGEYKVIISAGSFEGIANVQINRGEETVLDVYEFGRGSIKEGDINFKIEPFGAKLLINSEEVDYLNGPVKLDFGSYFIEIQAEGYETQKTTLTVDTPQKSISIYLTELADTTLTPTPTPEPTSEENTGEDNNGETTNAENNNPEGSEMHDISTYGFTIDPDHRVYILGPEGGTAAITNLDANSGITYTIGTIPCDFQKVIGDMQIIVTKGDKAQVFDYNESDDGADCFYDFTTKFE